MEHIQPEVDLRLEPTCNIEIFQQIIHDVEIAKPRMPRPSIVYFLFAEFYNETIFSLCFTILVLSNIQILSSYGVLLLRFSSFP